MVKRREWLSENRQSSLLNCMYLLGVTKTGNGEWGMGNGEWGMGNGEWGMGNGEWEIENGK